MPYQVLARKWRPKAFAELVGQTHVSQALSNAFASDRLHHAYLFTGTRGVGKTTIARIIAKCLNCEIGVTATPCGTCKACTEIDSGRFIDLLEIDAASRTKVEDTRELLDNVQYAPTVGRYKVYLIDEVHMLSGHSFNALLKTLEEPPPHVKFLLATTNPDKLPITVLSRCLQFHLKHLTPEQISSHLVKILEAEHIKYEPQALNLIATAADGSVRDSLSLLDQAISFSDGQVSLDAVQDMLGSLKPALVQDLVQALCKNATALVIEQIQQFAKDGVDFTKLLQDLLNAFEQLALQQALPDPKHPLHALASTLSPEDIQLWYQIGLAGRRDLTYAPSVRGGFTMILLRMLAFRPASSSQSGPEVQFTATPAVTNAQPPAAALKKPDPAPLMQAAAPREVARQPLMQATESSAPPPPAIAAEPSASNLDWEKTLPALGLTGISGMLASHCSLREYNNNSISLCLDPGQAPLLTATQTEKLEQAICNHLNKKVKLEIIIEGSDTESPAARRLRQKNEAQDIAVKKVKENPEILETLAEFDGKIMSNSIKSLIQPTEEE